MIRIHQFFYFIFISLLSQGFIDLILSDASATPSAIYDLGQLSNTRGTTEPVSINDQTIVLGNAISKSGEKFTPFYWTRWSGLHEIRELKNHRAITGNARLDVLIPEGVFSEGHLKLVPAAEPNVSIFAEDLNDSNEMVGSIFPFHRSFYDFFWDGKTAVSESISTFYSRVQINNDGRTIAKNGFGQYEIWPDKNRSSVLMTLNGTSAVLNNLGQVAICETFDNGAGTQSRLTLLNEDLTVSFSRDILTCLNASNSICCKVEGLNENGSVVGTAMENGLSYPFYYTSNDGWRNLNETLPPNSGWSLVTAKSINNFETIVGTGVFHHASRGYFLDTTGTFPFPLAPNARLPVLTFLFDRTCLAATPGEVCRLEATFNDSSTAPFSGWPISLYRNVNSRWKKVQTLTTDAQGGAIFEIVRRRGALYRVAAPNNTGRRLHATISSELYLP